jgi:hypothetical protein
MKATTLITALACLLIAVTSVGAQGVNDRASEGRAEPGSGAETRMLQHLLQMNDAELSNLRQTVERIEKMSPQEKAQLRERISKFDNMAPGKVAAMRKKFDAIPKEQRETMRKRWMEMSPEQRAEWRTQLNAMSPAERKALFEAQGFMAPPPHNHKKGPRAKRPNGKEPQSERGTKPGVESAEAEN